MAQLTLKPQDILLLAKLIVLQRHPLPLKQMTLAQDLALSASEIGKAMKRLVHANLVTSNAKPVNRNVTDFLIYGFKFVFPAEIGGLTRGIVTAYAAPPLSSHIKHSIEDIYVWPDANGDVRGQSLMPIYPSVGKACQKDAELYEFMALLDTLRVGRAREVQLAKDELRKRIKG